MSSNRIPAHQTMRNQNPLRQQRGLWLSIVPALVLALALGGCALNSTGLPGNLPIPPGGGTLTISRSTLVNGITGRTYTIWIPTSGGTGTLSSCTIIAGTLPAGLSIAISDDSTNAPPVTAVRFCKITGTISTAGPTTVNFTVQAADTATPANTASQAFTIFVRPEFTVTTATAFLDGRQNDHYGDPAEAKTPQPVVTDVSATVGNAPLNATAGVGCVFTIVGNPGFNLTPAPTSGNTCALSSGATPLAAAGAFTVTLAATDTDLMDTFAGQTTKIVVPRNAISSVALSLTVNPPVTATFNQAGNTVAASTLLDGVDARSYGTINAGAGAPTWSVTGGLGAGAAGLANYSWCVSAGGASVTAVGLTGISTSCAAPTAGVNSVSLTSAAVVQGSASFSVDVTDAGNAAVISRTITQGTSVINALAQLAGSFVQGVVTPNTNANSTLLDGVNAQSYGVINANAGAPTYAATGGLGVGTAGAAAYQWCVSAGGATVTAIGLAGISTNCAAPTTGTPVLLSTASAVTGAASFAVDLSDTGNAATPPAPNITFGTSTITVYSDFLATFNQSGNTNPASTLLPGVNTRSYGVIGGGAGAPTWTAAAGLGSGTAGATNYQWCVSAGAASVTATALGGISTNCAAPTTGASVTLTSASATTGAAVFSVDATDAGNEAVPSVTITQGTSTININPDLAVALQAVPASPDPTTPAAQAVVGRTYGAPLADVVYEVIGGLPAYVITPSGTLTTDTNIVCVSGATTSTCNSAGAGVTNTGGLNPSLTISATDTANAATPAAPAPATKTDVWTVNPAITFSLLPGPTGAAPNGVIPDGVVGRQYGTPLGTNDLVFTASGGLGNTAGFGLTGTASGTLLANGVSCSPATPQVGASVSVTCNSGGGVTTLSAPTGARTFVMTFSDAGNSTTPLGSTNTDSAGFTNYSNNVNAPLTVALQTVPASPDPTTAAGQAVEGRTYGAPAKTDVVYEVTGGLPAAAPPLYTITPSGTLTTDTNIVCTAGSTTATCNSGGAAVTNTGGVNPSLTISATDTSNALTPAAAAAATKTDTWTVNPPITFSLVPGATGVAPNGTIPDGVVGRQYGTPLGANDLVFTASG
ncbi:MAG: hypothetical protein M1453_14345, partial [Acidobacteria bacterium]|nr:hypothetical protein [Acidobacteriota bacterium]